MAGAGSRSPPIVQSLTSLPGRRHVVAGFRRDNHFVAVSSEIRIENQSEGSFGGTLRRASIALLAVQQAWAFSSQEVDCIKESGVTRPQPGTDRTVADAVGGKVALTIEATGVGALIGIEP